MAVPVLPTFCLDRGQALPLSDGAYELITVAIPSELIGVADVRLQFEAWVGLLLVLISELTMC